MTVNFSCHTNQHAHLRRLLVRVLIYISSGVCLVPFSNSYFTLPKKAHRRKNFHIHQWRSGRKITSTVTHSWCRKWVTSWRRGYLDTPVAKVAANGHCWPWVTPSLGRFSAPFVTHFPSFGTRVDPWNTRFVKENKAVYIKCFYTASHSWYFMFQFDFYF